MYATDWIALLIFTAATMAACFSGASYAALRLLRTIRAEADWTNTLDKAIEQAPAIIEGLGRLSIGVQEIIMLIDRAGGLKRKEK